MKKQHFREAITKINKIYDLRGIDAVLGWDQQTMMPPKGNDTRSRQSGVIASMVHDLMVDERLGELLEECIADPALSSKEYALVSEFKRDRERAVKIPAELVKELAEVSGQALPAWVEAKRKSDFSIFAPFLKKLIELRKQESLALGAQGGEELYDKQLDHYEPGMTVRSLDPVIERTGQIVFAAFKAISGARKKPDIRCLCRDFPEPAQEAFVRNILQKMGFDFDAGRIDRSEHPFASGLHPDDVRLTTRYNRNWLPQALFGAIHEAGHGLYEQGLSKAYPMSPLCEARSTGIHESQSRLWENMIGRGKPFWRHFLPKAKKAFPKALGRMSLDNFYFAINSIKPSLIRVEADEITYNLHILIRYQIEKAIFADEVRVADLPQLWNSKYEHYLGIKSKNDAQGVIQDIHWAIGMFGYFPTYLLGNLYAAQWMATMRREIRSFDATIAKGNLLPIKKWLNERVHQHGRRYSAAELTRKVSGEDLNPEHFGQYLKDKFAPIYNVNWVL